MNPNEALRNAHYCALITGLAGVLLGLSARWPVFAFGGVVASLISFHFDNRMQAALFHEDKG
jgi:hypothetical protein